MTFSRFFNHSILFFLLCSIAIPGRSIDSKDSAYNLTHPIFSKITSLPTTAKYVSILTDKDNRLFITTDTEVYSYNGVNYQRIAICNQPKIAYDGDKKIAIVGNNYLSLLIYSSNGGFDHVQLIDTSDSSFGYQITNVGFDDSNKIVFSTGSKLWRFNQKPILIDSSDQPITIFSTTEGLVIHSYEKGYYRMDGKSTFVFNEIKRHIHRNEKVKGVMAAGSYLFVSTSLSRLLMIDSNGRLTNIIKGFGDNYSELPLDITSHNNIDFFAITATQIFRFVNPSLIEIYNSKNNIEGTINSVKTLDGKLFIATSFGLYTLNQQLQEKTFTLIAEGDFHSLCVLNQQVFAIGSNGLFVVSNTGVKRIDHEFGSFQKTSIINSKIPLAIFINREGLHFAVLSPPYLIKRLSAQNFSNYYTLDSTMLLRTLEDKWFLYQPATKTLIDQRPIKKGPVFLINFDTISILDDKAYKHRKGGHFTSIGITNNNKIIYTSKNNFHPDFQSFFVENSEYPAFFSIERSFTVNDLFLDLDSTTWLATNIGLIRISSVYIKNINGQGPKISALVINPENGELLHLLTLSNSHFKYKQGCTYEVQPNAVGLIGWNNITYSYKLDVKTNWTDWSNNSKINLGALKPGYYKCFIKSRDVNGNESLELPLSFTIIPKFFHTQFTVIALIFFIFLIIYAISLWRIFYFAQERFKLESIINRRTEELVKEKEKTDNLLARVLPKETATELKETGKVVTQIFKMATVLFSDIQGFTKITDELNPENLIDQLDKFFLHFDSVVDKYRIEKIKTIGDAYMCAGGIPHKNRTNPVEVVLAALEMLSFMREINLEHNPGQDIWDLRIGIDTGQVIAGVVGRNKLSYDIWGTTVNTASRMESSGEVGRINISGNTHIFVQDYFICTYRGKMPIKNKGDIEMYFVDGIKPILSNNLDLYKPNMEFQIQLQFLRFGDLEEFILEKLEKGLPKNLYYHNLKHTVDVYTQVELIGRSEEVSLEEQLLLQTAALFHDAGHLIDYDTHEEMGVKLAREILPEYQYSERQIQILSELIMVTKLPPKPKNLLEAIMCDADLDYLGRTDFIPVSNMLYKELHEHGRIGTIQEWNELQIKFIEKHQYFTNTARKLRNVNKNSQLDNIKNWIEKNKL